MHMALNCGATSCPPVQSYTADKIDKELRASAISVRVCVCCRLLLLRCVLCVAVVVSGGCSGVHVL